MSSAQEAPRRRWRRGLLLSLSIVTIVIAAGGAFVATWRQDSYDKNVQRLHNALPAPTTTSRPAADPGQNWLLVGSDQRGASVPAKWRSGQSHSDTIMLLHLPATGERAYVISIPRDSWVEVPGHGMSKINGSFALGGPRLLTETVERLSQVRIDHFAAIDFDGFKQMTDALGGVEIELEQPVRDPSNGWSWPAGRNRLNGTAALHFVRERKGLPGSDVDRVKRQHAFIKAMAGKAASGGTLTNPVRLDGFLQAMSKAVAIDDTANFATLRGLALRMARVGPDRITFVSVPVGETAWVGRQNIVLLDTTLSTGLFNAVRQNQVGAYIEAHDLRNEVDKVR